MDELITVSKSLQAVANALINKNDFNLKGTGPTSYHLGYGLNQDISNKKILSLLNKHKVDQTNSSCLSTTIPLKE